MATNNDFNNLIGRIDTATNTLENNVNVLVQSSSDVVQSAKLCFNHPNIKDNESMFKEADTTPDELEVNGDSNEG